MQDYLSLLLTAEMAIYTWPARGRQLIQLINYANSFAFMLYGWDAGKQ